MNVTERVYSLTAAAERGFVRDVKEKLRYMWCDTNGTSIGAERFHSVVYCSSQVSLATTASGFHDYFLPERPLL